MRSFVLFIVLILALVVGIAAWKLTTFLLIPPSAQETAQINFEILPDSSFQKVSESLVDKGLIKDAFLFKILAKATGLTANIRIGEYALNKAMTPLDVLKVIRSGKSIQYAITFPEGMNMFEMAQLFEDKGLGMREDFLKYCTDPFYIKEILKQDLPSFEGYLFPETYLITKFTGAKKLIQLMVSRFNQTYKQLTSEAKLKMPIHNLVTLASIIEKETGAPDERPMISSVFHNRLKRGMRLQSDPTIIYGIMDLNGGQTVNNITKKDIVTKTRYNTYKVSGLPYGPIANPGEKALEAALNPSESDFLYFVSRNNGTHVFSRTYSEHQEAVKRFQLDARMRAGRSWRNLNKGNE